MKSNDYLNELDQELRQQEQALREWAAPARKSSEDEPAVAELDDVTAEHRYAVLKAMLEKGPAKRQELINNLRNSLATDLLTLRPKDREALISRLSPYWNELLDQPNTLERILRALFKETYAKEKSRREIQAAEQKRLNSEDPIIKKLSLSEACAEGADIAEREDQKSPLKSFVFSEKAWKEPLDFLKMLCETHPLFLATLTSFMDNGPGFDNFKAAFYSSTESGALFTDLIEIIGPFMRPVWSKIASTPESIILFLGALTNDAALTMFLSALCEHLNPSLDIIPNRIVEALFIHQGQERESLKRKDNYFHQAQATYRTLASNKPTTEAEKCFFQQWASSISSASFSTGAYVGVSIFTALINARFNIEGLVQFFKACPEQFEALMYESPEIIFQNGMEPLARYFAAMPCKEVMVQPWWQRLPQDIQQKYKEHRIKSLEEVRGLFARSKAKQEIKDLQIGSVALVVGASLSPSAKQAKTKGKYAEINATL